MHCYILKYVIGECVAVYLANAQSLSDTVNQVAHLY